jgi:transaldolase
VPAADAAAGTSSTLTQLAQLMPINIDSCDLDAVAKFASSGAIQDATTCPFYVAQAATNGDDRYQDLIFDATQYTKRNLGGGEIDLADPDLLLNMAMDKLAVNLGAKLLELIPGSVHTEVDIRQSYNTQESIARARRLVQMYKEMGIDKDRVVIKLAGTWEGIQAARALEKEGIRTNITLVFSFLQVAAAAQAGCFTVSPFPGRILDWCTTKSGRSSYIPAADPGVLSTKRMYAYLKKYGYDTICMPASFRSSTGGGGTNGANGVSMDPVAELDQVLALVGVDQMTLPVRLLEILSTTNVPVTMQVDAKEEAAVCCDPDFTLTKETWDLYIPSDPCVMDKFEEGLRMFKSDTEKIRSIFMDQW